LKIWMTPFSSVAIIEKLALLKIAFCNVQFLNQVSWRMTSVFYRVSDRGENCAITDFFGHFQRDPSAKNILVMYLWQTITAVIMDR
jgi:hypothetical protein